MDEDAPRKTTFTPVYDLLVEKHGSSAALVFGAVLRFIRMSPIHACTVSRQAIAKRVGLKGRSITAYLKLLVDEGYLDNLAENKHNKGVYCLTDKARNELGATDSKDREQLANNANQVSKGCNQQLAKNANIETLLRDSSRDDEERPTRAKRAPPVVVVSSNGKRKPKDPQKALEWERERQTLLFASFGLTAGPKVNTILDGSYPIKHLVGWMLETILRVREGVTPEDKRGGHFITQVLEGWPLPKRVDRLAELRAEDWTELMLCAQAAHAKNAPPPLAYLSKRLRAVWDDWAALFTTGSAETGAREHYALRVGDVPDALTGRGLEQDVTAWIAEHAAEGEPAA